MTLPILTLRPNSRFSINEFPPNLPSKCAVCGSPGGDGRKFIDFGFDLDFYGTIYFCTNCLGECANTQGYATPDQYNYALSQNEELEFKLSQMEAENAIFRNSLNSLNFLGTGRLNGENSRQVSEESSESDIFVGTDYNGPRQDDNRFDEQTNESGSENVQTTDGHLTEESDKLSDRPDESDESGESDFDSFDDDFKF